MNLLYQPQDQDHRCHRLFPNCCDEKVFEWVPQRSSVFNTAPQFVTEPRPLHHRSAFFSLWSSPGSGMEVWGEEKVSWPLSLWDSMLDKADYISKRKSLYLFIPIRSTCTLMERLRFDFLFYLETVDHAIFLWLAPFSERRKSFWMSQESNPGD